MDADPSDPVGSISEDAVRTGFRYLATRSANVGLPVTVGDNFREDFPFEPRVTVPTVQVESEI